MKVAIIGGGLTGLSSAYYMGKAFPAWEIHVLESSNRLGWKGTNKNVVMAYVVEVGPDSYLARKTSMTDLVKELGLGDTLVRNATGESYIYHQGQMKPIPGGSIIGIPTEFLPFAMSSLLSWFGKLRAGLDIFKKPYPGNEDMSIDVFFRYHLGDELVNLLIEPLLSGIYGGDLKRLSFTGNLSRISSIRTKAWKLGQRYDGYARYAQTIWGGYRRTICPINGRFRIISRCSCGTNAKERFFAHID